jgi:hypothetical protein
MKVNKINKNKKNKTNLLREISLKQKKETN